MTGSQVGGIILILVAIIIGAVSFVGYSNRKNRKARNDEQRAEAHDAEPSARKQRFIIPEIMIELDAAGKALDISRYAIEASIGMRRTAWEARREARHGAYGADRHIRYDQNNYGQTEPTQPESRQVELDNWHFVDDDSS